MSVGFEWASGYLSVFHVGNLRYKALSNVYLSGGKEGGSRWCVRTDLYASWGWRNLELVAIACDFVVSMGFRPIWRNLGIDGESLEGR